jgi:cell division protein FtsB
MFMTNEEIEKIIEQNQETIAKLQERNERLEKEVSDINASRKVLDDMKP